MSLIKNSYLQKWDKNIASVERNKILTVPASPVLMPTLFAGIAWGLDGRFAFVGAQGVERDLTAGEVSEIKEIAREAQIARGRTGINGDNQPCISCGLIGRCGIHAVIEILKPEQWEGTPSPCSGRRGY